MKRSGRENPKIRKLIIAMKKKKESFYDDLVKYMTRPSRVGVSVNVSKIGSGDAVVPGTVMGTGEIAQAGKVYALRFSKSAKAKIEKAGGKCLPIEALLEGKEK